MPSLDTRTLNGITGDDVKTYTENGAICLRKMFSARSIELMCASVDKRIKNPGPMRHEFSRSGKVGRFFDDNFLWTSDDNFKNFVFNSPAALIAAKLMGSSKVNIFFDQLLVKEPGASDPTPWHQDKPFWPVDGWQLCSIWLALDPVTKESGAVEYVKGSHKWGQQYLAETFKGKGCYKSDLPKIPDIEAMRGDLEIMQWELAPGDCVVHHALTIHGAPGNLTQAMRRRGLITRWAGDDARYSPLPDIQPLLYEPGIPNGAPLDCELFPQIWPR